MSVTDFNRQFELKFLHGFISPMILWRVTDMKETIHDDVDCIDVAKDRGQ
jgi:hypothetical protein